MFAMRWMILMRLQIFAGQRAKILGDGNRESGRTGNQLFFYIQKNSLELYRIRAEVELKMEIRIRYSCVCAAVVVDIPYGIALWCQPSN